MQSLTEVCPGCGLEGIAGAMDERPARYQASSACGRLYNELAYYTLSLSDAYFIHQLIVDAYGAQHTGPQTKPVTTVFALVGLQLAIEKGYTGRQVQRAHMILAPKRKDWPRLDIPDQTATITVQDVLLVDAGEQRTRRIHDWTESVWQRWEPQHDWVRYCVSQYQL